MAKRTPRHPVIDVRHLEPAVCPHNRQVRWTETEFGCLECKQAFRQTADGLVPIPKIPEGPRDPSTTPTTALRLSPEALRVLRGAHLTTVQDVLDHRDRLLQLRNVGKTLEAEIKASLNEWQTP